MKTNTTNQKHTPTPWKAKKITPVKYFGKTHSHLIKGEDVNGCIADVYKENGQANALFIVKAVNEHEQNKKDILFWQTEDSKNNAKIDKLVETLKEVEKDLQHKTPSIQWCLEIINQALKDLGE